MRELSQKYLKHHFKYSRHFDSNKNLNTKFFYSKTCFSLFFITIPPQIQVYSGCIWCEMKLHSLIKYWRPTYGTNCFLFVGGNRRKKMVSMDEINER